MTYSALYGTARYDESYYGVMQEDITSDSYIKKLDTTETINSDSYIKVNDNSILIISYAYIQQDIPPYSITSDAWIKGAANISGISFIKKITDKTITSEGYIKSEGSEGTITSDSFIKKTYQETLNSDAVISYRLGTETLSSDSFIKVIDNTETITSDNWINYEREIQIISYAYIKHDLPVYSITSDAWISGIQRITSDSAIRISGNDVTINSDSWILEEQPETIISNSMIKTSYEVTIDSDSYIKNEYSPSGIFSNSFIKAAYEETLNSDSEIKATIEQTIDGISLIKTDYSTTIVSDSVIEKGAVEVTIASDAHISTGGVISGRATNTNEVIDYLSPSTMTFTPTNRILFKSLWVKCKGGSPTIDGQIKLTCNGVDSNTINIGQSSSDFSWYEFIFTTPIDIAGGTLTTITITELAGLIIVKSGQLDYSGWNVRLS